MTRLFSAVALLLTLSCCQKATQELETPGWAYDANPLWPGAIYHFGDGEGTKLTGRCHSGPVFLLSGGTYPDMVESFELIIDGRPRKLKAFNGAHGRALIVDDAASMIELVAATRTITFRVGDWARTAPADEAIRKLSTDCKQLRERYPH